MKEGKVSAMFEWPQPASVKEVQRFLGFANFYHRFMCSFSIVAAQFSNLLKENPKRIEFMPEATKAVPGLKLLNYLRSMLQRYCRVGSGAVTAAW